MTIEIRELLIKVKIEEPLKKSSGQPDMHQMQQTILKACKKEIKKQLNTIKER